MTRFAVLADIHGNADALQAVLDDMAARGLEEAVNLGDHFSGPLEAAATADLLIPRGFPTIRGNHDRQLLEEEPAKMSASDRVAHGQLRPEHFNWLATLPATLLFNDEVFLCHGTPESDQTYWLERVRPDGSVGLAALAEIAPLASGIEASLILCGHTHIPRLVRLASGVTILNPGSVGLPAYSDDAPFPHLMQAGTPNASYAIVEKEAAGWSVTFRSVPYDSHRMVELAKAQGRSDWAQALATGWIEAEEPQ